jgi:Flp pilus assembly pilin Flp
MFTTIYFHVHKFRGNTSGATAIEYALIAAVMAGLIVTAIAVLDLEGIFQTIADAMAV